MNWSSLTKEQKQAVVLISMWVVIGVGLVYYFLIAPFLQDRGNSNQALEELRVKLEKAEVAMQGAPKLRVEYQVATGELDKAVEQYVVPMVNPLSWVTEKVYNAARSADVDIQSVAEMMLQSAGWDSLIKSERSFKPYGVRIVTECSYQQLLKLVEVLEDSNPYLCFSGISISVNDQSPLKHTIFLVAEWPMWGKQIDFGWKSQGEAGE